MKKFLQNIVKLKEISTIKDFRFGTFPSISGSGSGSGYTFYRPPFKTTFNNISVILWLSVLLVEETEVAGENDLPVASH
jgi:hypothetical protein